MRCPVMVFVIVVTVGSESRPAVITGPLLGGAVGGVVGLYGYRENQTMIDIITNGLHTLSLLPQDYESICTTRLQLCQQLHQLRKEQACSVWTIGLKIAFGASVGWLTELLVNKRRLRGRRNSRNLKTSGRSDALQCKRKNLFTFETKSFFARLVYGAKSQP